MKRRRCGEMPLHGEIFGQGCRNQEIPSKQLFKPQQYPSWLSIISALLLSVNIEAQQSLDLECYELLQQTRYIYGFELKTSDYATVVSGMSRGTLEPLFDQLPRNFHEHFRIKADQPCRDHQDWGYCIDLQSSQKNALPTFCREVRSEIEASIEAAPSPATLPRSETIYPSTKQEREEISTPTYLRAKVSAPSTSFGTIHQDRRLQSIQDCKIYISIADADRSNGLKKVEYVEFLNRMSRNQFSGSSFADLPQRFQDYFENNKGAGGIDVAGARPGQTPTTAQADSLSKLCDDTKDLLTSSSNAPVGSPTGGGGGGPTSRPAVDCSGTIAVQQCYIAIAISDRNRDDLLQEDDYIRFVNRLSDNEYVDVDQLGQLPSNIRSNFGSLARNGAINISGSKPGQSASKAQTEFLSRVCCETDLAIKNPGDMGTSGPLPTPAPVGPRCASSVSRQQCNIFLSIADLSKDNFLNQVEYVRFLDRLSTTGEFSGVSFGNLPTKYITNYEKFATVEGQIDVFGSKPGQTTSEAQNAFVNALCCETARLVEGGSPPPTLSPTVGQGSNPPSTAPSIAESECFQNLQAADLFKDSFLSTTEYVRLVNLLGGDAFEGLTYEELPCELLATFEILSIDSGTIPIFGATSETASEEQKFQALNVCYEVANSILGGGEYACSSPPSIAPDVTDSPTTQPPTAAAIDGAIEIYNAFVILNTRGIVADRLTPGTPNRNGLDAAYDTFVTETAGRAISSATELTSSLRGRRRLEVVLQPNSAALYSIVDAECPFEQADATCQVGYGRFRVDVTNEYEMQIIERYTNFTQNDILNGLLQAALEKEDPNSVLRIVDAFFPVRDPTAPTSPPRTNAPQTPAGPADSGSSNTGAIVGGVIGGLLLCGIFIAIGWYTSKRVDLAPKPTKGVATGGDDDNSVIGGEGGNIVRPSSMRDNPGNIFDNIKNRLGVDDDDDDDSDQEDQYAFGTDFKDPAEEADGKKEKEKTNIFGFAKKEKKGKGGDVFGLDTGVDSDSSSDSGKYGFEDPDEDLGPDEDGEDEDDAGSKEELFESNMSPAWGTTETGFGSDWGAGSNDLANEFLGKPFGEVDLDGNDADGKAADATPGVSAKSTEEDDEDEDGEEEDSKAESSFSEEDSAYESNNDSEASGAQNEADNSSSADNDKDNSSSADSEEEGEGEEKVWDDKSLESEKNEEDDEDDLSDEDQDEDASFDQSQYSASSRTSTSEEHRKRIEYRAQVDALVRIVLPDQMDKVEEMMDQFHGREPELISTLQNMQERSATQRARQAVHQSKTKPDRIKIRAEGSYAGAENMMGASEGSAAGTAAIAAASLPIPVGGFDEPIPEDDEGFDGDNAFGDYDSQGEDEGSYYSGDNSMDRDSQSDDGPSFADEESQDRSYDDQDRSFADDRDQSFGEEGGDSRGSFFSGDEDMDDDGFGKQASNAFGDANAFGGDAFGSNAFGSQGADAFDTNAFGSDAFGSPGANAFDDKAFGNAFGSNAFGEDNNRQADDQGFGDSQGSYSQDQSASMQDDRGRPNDQGFGDEDGDSQGSSYYGDQRDFERGDRGRPNDQGFDDEEGYSQGSYSQDERASGQGGLGRPNDQGFDDEEGYSQGSYSQEE